MKYSPKASTLRWRQPISFRMWQVPVRLGKMPALPLLTCLAGLWAKVGGCMLGFPAVQVTSSTTPTLGPPSPFFQFPNRYNRGPGWKMHPCSTGRPRGTQGMWVGLCGVPHT